MINLILVGLGGFAGSICRYTASRYAARMFPSALFPYGTLFVNVTGCLLIGLLGGIFEARQVLSPELRALILVGFLGGFTTFSTFGNDLFLLARNGQSAAALADLAVHIVLGLGAVWLGFNLSRLFPVS